MEVQDFGNLEDDTEPYSPIAQSTAGQTWHMPPSSCTLPAANSTAVIAPGPANGALSSAQPAATACATNKAASVQSCRPGPPAHLDCSPAHSGKSQQRASSWNASPTNAAESIGALHLALHQDSRHPNINKQLNKCNFQQINSISSLHPLQAVFSLTCADSHACTAPASSLAPQSLPVAGHHCDSSIPLSPFMCRRTSTSPAFIPAGLSCGASCSPQLPSIPRPLGSLPSSHSSQQDFANASGPSPEQALPCSRAAHLHGPDSMHSILDTHFPLDTQV